MILRPKTHKCCISRSWPWQTCSSVFESLDYI